MRQLKTEEKQLKVEVVLPANASHVLYATCRAVLYATWRAVLYATCRAVLYADAAWQVDALIEQLTSLGVNCRQILEDSFGQSVPPDRPRSSLDRRAHARARSTHCPHAYTYIRTHALDVIRTVPGTAAARRPSSFRGECVRGCTASPRDTRACHCVPFFAERRRMRAWGVCPRPCLSARVRLSVCVRVVHARVVTAPPPSRSPRRICAGCFGKHVRASRLDGRRRQVTSQMDVDLMRTSFKDMGLDARHSCLCSLPVSLRLCARLARA